MMPEAKYIYSSIVLGSVLLLSGCSGSGSPLDLLRVDTVDDTVDYRNTSKSIRSLAIPPGLSNPIFNSTYASNGSGGSAAAVSSNSGGSSLGSALLAQSAAGNNAPAKTARVQRASTGLPQVKMMRLKGGEPALALNAPAASSWKVLETVLPKAGFNVVKQQAGQGIFTTKYKGPARANLKPGQTNLILLAENASRQSFIGIADANGKPLNEAGAQAVLSLIRAQFQR